MMGWKFNGVITLTVFIYVYNMYCVCFELSIYGVSCECVCGCVYRCGHFPETVGLLPNASHDLVVESTCTGWCSQTSQWRRQTQETHSATNPTSTRHSTVGPSTLTNGSTSRPTVALPPTMVQTPPNMSAPSSPTVVAGIVVGGVSSTVHGTKRRHGERDKDISEGEKRKCRRYVGNSRSDKEAQECKGSWVRRCDLGYSCVVYFGPVTIFKKYKLDYHPEVHIRKRNVLKHECNVIV